MRTRWFKLLSALTLVGVLTCVGCGGTAPEDAPSPKESTEEFQKDPSLRGEKPDDVAPEEKPAEKAEG